MNQIEVIEIESDSDEEKAVPSLLRRIDKLREQVRAAENTTKQLRRQLRETKNELETVKTSSSMRTGPDIETLRNLEQMKLLAHSNQERHLAAQRQASSKQAALEELWKVFECTICMETIWEPIMFDCGHFFCEPCVVKYKPKTCPICSTPIQLPPSKIFQIREMVRIIAPHVSDERSPQKKG